MANSATTNIKLSFLWYQ